MSLAKRRLLFYFFIFLFAAVVPIILLYATGNSINWQRLELERTAGIIADSEPAGATLTLNGELPVSLTRQFFGQAPDPHTKTKLTGLRPGDYLVRLELPGYASWEEKISLQPGQIHNTGKIRLFQNNAPQLIAATPTGKFFLSPDGETVALLAANQLTLHSLADGATATVSLPAAAGGAELAWSPNNESVRIGNEYIYDRSAKKLIDIRKDLTINPQFLRWSPDGRLWALQENKLRRLDIAGAGTPSILDLKPLIGTATIDDVRIENNHVLALIDAAGAKSFIIFDSSAPEHQNRLSLPEGTYQFSQDSQGDVLLHESGRGALYRLERPLPLLSSYHLVLVAEHYATGQWNDNELFYATPFELRRWTAENPEELLSRWGEAIVDIARLPKSDYYLFATGDSLYVRSAKEQQFTDSLRLAQIEKVDAFVRVDEKDLYFSGNVNGQQGLYRLDF